MALHADAGCIMKVNVHCEACKMKAIEVLNSIIGVYSVTLDANEGIASIYGEVDPNIFTRAIATSGRHGQLVHANVKHPQINYNGSNNYSHSGYSYVAQGNPYGYSYRRTFPDYYHPRRVLHPAAYGPRHAPRKYHRYDQGAFNCCSMM